MIHRTNAYLHIIISVAAALYFLHYAQTATDWHFIDNVNLIIHEAGHVVFSPFGEFLHMLGGSLMQIALPVAFVLYFIGQSDVYSASLTLFWVGQNCINVSVYAGDAQNMALPLLGGDNVIHDWNYLLSTNDLLSYTHAISASLYWCGILIIAVGLFGALYDAFRSLSLREMALE